MPLTEFGGCFIVSADDVSGHERAELMIFKPCLEYGIDTHTHGRLLIGEFIHG